MRYYGRKVKGLGAAEHHDLVHPGLRVHPNVFQVLAPFFQKFQILCNVSALTTTLLSLYYLDYASIVMHLSLDSLTLELSSANTKLPLWENITLTPSSIKKVTIAYTRRSCILGRAPLRHPLQPTYYNFASLEVLDATAICTPWKSISSLATVPNLRVLHIYITSDDLATFLSTEPDKRDFQNLTDFRLISDGPSQFSNLLLRPGFHNLQSLQIAYPAASTVGWDVDSFSRILRDTQASSTTLRTIRISIQHHPSTFGINPLPSYLELHKITATTLKPLFRFVNLEHLYLDLGSGVNITDENLHDASKAWSKLKTFELPEEMRFLDPKVTFLGISDFAKSCPLLETVSLRINGLSECNIPIQWVCENLTSLSVCMSPIDPDSHKVGRMLAKLFPKLQSISWSWYMWNASGHLSRPSDTTPLEKEYLDRWARVNTYLSGPCRGRDSCVCASFDLWNPALQGMQGLVW